MYRVVILTQQWFCTPGDIQQRHSPASFTICLPMMLNLLSWLLLLAPYIFRFIYETACLNFNLDVPTHLN